MQVAHRFNSEDSLALAMWDKLKANAGRKMAKSFQASAIPVSSGLGRKGGTPTPAPAEDTHTSCRSDLTVIPATISVSGIHSNTEIIHIQTYVL